jgi:hypothetical protein
MFVHDVLKSGKYLILFSIPPFLFFSPTQHREKEITRMHQAFIFLKINGDLRTVQSFMLKKNSTCTMCCLLHRCMKGNSCMPVFFMSLSLHL